jgi:hypothetical protein
MTLEPLIANFPEELTFFQKVFIWGGSSDCFFTRSFYEETVVDGCWARSLTEEERRLTSTRSGFIIPRWRPYRTKHGTPQKLYPELVDSLTEKHLAFDNFCRSCSSKDRLRPQEWETGFWLGTVAGPRTWSSALDIDLHEQIGWYSKPTRWCQPDRDAPHETRYLPVPRPSLRFYMQAKLVHDAFPNRIWAFSSGSLGFAVWRLLPEPELTHVSDRKIRSRLNAIGLRGLEHYPAPKNPRATLGRPHRRPCGMDSGIITPNGVLIDPVDQIRWFMAPGQTPSFEKLVREHISAVRKTYECFLRGGGSEDHHPLQPKERADLVGEAERTLGHVAEWLDKGSPVDAKMLGFRKLTGGRSPNQTPELGTDIINSTCVVGGLIEGRSERKSTNDKNEGTFPFLAPQHPASFYSVDLPQIIEQGLWLEFVRFLVEEGFPVQDKFFEIVGTLAKWFVFVELFDRPDSETIHILTTYVLNQHSNKISRIEGKKAEEVISQISRIVQFIKTSTDSMGGCFEEIRRKRATGRYRTIWNFSPKILGIEQKGDNSAAKVAKSGSEQWRYEPDDTPLPEFLVQKIIESFREAGRQIRRGRDGNQPVLVAITRFLNHLNAGQGSRRCSIKLLQQMGFPSRGRDLQQIMGLLVKAGIVSKGGYLSRSRSRLWILTEEYRR